MSRGLKPWVEYPRPVIDGYEAYMQLRMRRDACPWSDGPEREQWLFGWDAAYSEFNGVEDPRFD